MKPRWEAGDTVRVVRNVRDDGTFPGANRGDLLVRRGSIGTVVDIGSFLMDQIIYSVHFLQPNRLVGCREEELLDLNDIWVDSAFETRDRVRNKHGLTVRGELKVPAGSIGEILMVLRDGDENRASYHVHFDCFAGHPLIIREAALDSIQALQEEAPHV